MAHTNLVSSIRLTAYQPLVRSKINKKNVCETFKLSKSKFRQKHEHQLVEFYIRFEVPFLFLYFLFLFYILLSATDPN